MERFFEYLCVLSLLTCFTTCQKEQNVLKWVREGDILEVSLEQYTDSTYGIMMTVNNKKHNDWPLPYPVYRWDYGDVTGDGIPDIAVGVIKPTRFDPKPDKRLFLFRITDKNYIRPLWLGSRVAQPLEDFRITKADHPGLIRTIEKEKSGNFLVAEYAWRGFGLEFKRYVEREIQLQKAQKLMKEK